MQCEKGCGGDNCIIRLNTMTLILQMFAINAYY